MPGPRRSASQGSATRLLVLGCVRIFQPVHGYFLRRELMSWEVERWAHIHPGSIYNALKTLTKAGLLAEIETPTGHTAPAHDLRDHARRATPSSSRSCGRA